MTMNNFIFENSTKVFFGKGCVKEYLCCLTKPTAIPLCYVMAAAQSKKTVSMTR